MRILEKLWHGDITPNARRLSPDSEQYELTEYIARHTEALMSMLTDEARGVFEKQRKNQSELASLNECEAFISGAKLGAKIMLEVVESMDAPYIDD